MPNYCHINLLSCARLHTFVLSVAGLYKTSCCPEKEVSKHLKKTNNMCHDIKGNIRLEYIHINTWL